MTGGATHSTTVVLQLLPHCAFEVRAGPQTEEYRLPAYEGAKEDHVIVVFMSCPEHTAEGKPDTPYAVIAQ